MANVSCLQITLSATLISGRKKRSQERLHHFRICAALSQRGDVGIDSSDRPVIIKSPLPSRTPANLPEPAPIEHSSAYLLQTSKHKENVDEIDSRQRRLLDGHRTDEPFNGNAVDWVLKKVDKSLDSVEENPPAYAKAIYEISTGPVGEAASKGAAAAAKITMEVGTQAIKAAAPVGKWVLSQGFKAAVAAVGKGISSALKKKSSKGKQ